MGEGHALETAARIERAWKIGYVLVAGALVLAAAVFSYGMRHMLQYPAADIWQHLAAINAIAERPFDPTNPFVESHEPSRLFGPLWVVVGWACAVFNLDVVTGFWIGGIVNLGLLFTGIWVLGKSLFGGAGGAAALLAAMLGGWLLPPNFTGFHSPLTLFCTAGYPAITAVACSLILWALSLRWLGGWRVGPWVVATVALAFATHPLGTSVGLAGCGSILVLGPNGSMRRRIELGALIAAGLAIAAAWPYVNPWRVLMSASSRGWGVGVDFYNPWWILGALFPAIAGLPFLFRRDLRPFLALLVACTIGFALGATSDFVAGHRLLSWIALLLQIGLAAGLMQLVRSRTRPAVAMQGLAICCIVIQSFWTYGKLEEIRREADREGSLLDAARAVLADSNGGFAGYLGATFPLTALGQRVLATSYAEPMVSDMERRQTASKRLFEAEDREARIGQAQALGVRYLVADARVIPPGIAQRLSRQSKAVFRSGNLIRYQLY